VKFCEVWSEVGSDFLEGKIKPVGTGRIFRDENSTKRAPPTSYPVVTCSIEHLEFAAMSAHTLNSEREERCAPLSSLHSLRGPHVKFIYTEARPDLLEARHAA
jgi:hypothetical protein